MPDGPAAPIEKLFTRMSQAEEFGKEFDEAKERRVLGLPPAEGRAPMFIQENRTRTQMTNREDRAGRRELEEEALRSSATSQQADSALLRAQLAQAHAQIAELKGEAPPASVTPGPQPPAPGEHEGPVTIPDGVPTMENTARQMKEWAKANAIVMPKSLDRGSKSAILDHLLANLPKEESAPEGEAVTA